MKLQSEIEAAALCCPKNLSDLKCLLSRVRSDIPSQVPSLTLHITSTHLVFFRYLKPNSELVPNNYNAIMITEQLRYAGVLEAVRVFRVGYHSNEDESVLGTNLFLERSKERVF